MTESQINAVIGAITTGGLNTAVEAVNAWNALKGELFPAPVVVEWNGTTSVNPTTDIIVSSTLETGKVKFKVYFWKSGNTVHCKGTIENYSGAIFADRELITFPTDLYKPLFNGGDVIVRAERYTSPLTSAFVIGATFQGMGLSGNMEPSIFKYAFNFTYKVAN